MHELLGAFIIDELHSFNQKNLVIPSYKIQILLSTYNGERFLTQQLDSLLAQDYPDFTIVIRDDGSSDKTCDILSEYQSKHSNITVIFADNIGVTGSYFELVKHASGDFYALCDQDDIWLPGKLRRGLDMISKCSDPAFSLYCSALQYVDSGLQYLGASKPPRYQCLENAVMENIASGCTVVFGEKLRQLFLEADPCEMHMHDWWLYLLASAFGDVVFDSEYQVLYRRHENTVTGLQLKSSRTILARLHGFWGFLFNGRQLYGLNQAAIFGKVYATRLSAEQQKLFYQLHRLYEFKGLRGRMIFAFSSPVLLNNKLDNLAIRFLVLLGKY